MNRHEGLEFWKLSGAGNDFVIIDLIDLKQRSAFEELMARPQCASSRSDFVRAICDRHFGIGADGLLFIEPPQRGGHLRWDFYNRDGSQAEMCGNAARCAGRWAFVSGLQFESVLIETHFGLVRAEQSEDQTVRVWLKKPKIEKSVLTVNLETETVRGMLIDSGVPHFVIETTDVLATDALKDLARRLRRVNDFGSRGANITFVSSITADRAKAITFERGVEDFTLACGTGALATATFLKTRQPGLEDFQIQMPGGILIVTHSSDQSEVCLRGEARLICRGSIDEEAIWKTQNFTA